VPGETLSPVTLSEAKGPGMDPHDHRDASLALSVTCAMFLRSAGFSPVQGFLMRLKPLLRATQTVKQPQTLSES